MSVETAAKRVDAALRGDARVGINAHLLSGEAGYRRAGIHQYILQVLRHLPSAAADYTVFTRQPQLLADRPHLRTAVTRWPTERRLVRIFWEQLLWAWAARRLRLDLLHSMAFVTPVAAPCPTVVTVYDLSFELFPDRFPALQRRYLQSQTRRSCRQARRIITISESSRRDVHRLFGVPLARIDVVVPGLDGMYRPRPLAEVDAFRRRQKLPTRFVLHVGTLQPRKNLLVLLEAFAKLSLTDVALVLVGGKGWFFDEIFKRVQALGLTERVIFTGYVPDEALPLWYSTASVLALPSVYEGFGLPVVEAMACGTPVVAAQSSSLPEAGGEAARYFAPDDPEALAAQLTAVLTDDAIAAQMRTAGLAQAARFSWARAGRETAVSYHQALQ